MYLLTVINDPSVFFVRKAHLDNDNKGEWADGRVEWDGREGNGRKGGNKKEKNRKGEHIPSKTISPAKKEIFLGKPIALAV